MARDKNAASGANPLPGRNSTTPKPISVAKPPVFVAALDSLRPYLGDNAIASLSNSQIIALARETGLKESYLTTLAAAHNLAATTNIPADVLFGLAQRDGPTDRAGLAAAEPRDLRNRIESAVKENLVPSETLTAFNAAAPVFASLQSNEAPLKALVDNYDLKVPDPILRKLESHGIETLIDVRYAGGLARVKGLNLKADDPAVRTLEAHAELARLPIDQQLSKRMIAAGFDSVLAIADAQPQPWQKGLRVSSPSWQPSLCMPMRERKRPLQTTRSLHSR